MNMQEYLNSKRDLYHSDIEGVVRQHKLSEPMIDVLKRFQNYPRLTVSRQSWMNDKTLMALVRRGLMVFMSGGHGTKKITNHMKLTETGQKAVEKLHFEGYAHFCDAQVQKHPRVIELKARLEGVFAEFAGTPEMREANEDLLAQTLVHRTMQAYPASWTEEYQNQILEAEEHHKEKIAANG
jgi:hypothetical protein